MKPTTPIVKHLLLVGGGHSHLAVLRRLAMRPVPGLATTLISRDIVTPYSGSLPGFLAGVYSADQMHIDLRPLAQFAGVRLIQAEVTGIDLQAQQLELGPRPAMGFDVLSLNIGSRPNAQLIPGAREHAVGIKPIDTFIRRWQDIRGAATAALTSDGGRYHLVIVGGGPASVEFALAAQARINLDLGRSPDQPSAMAITLVCGAATLLSGHNDKTRAFALAELRRRGIDVLLDHQVEAFESRRVVCKDAAHLAADAMVYATGASLPQWAAQLGLAISEDGFIEVGQTLQSSSHDFVFAAGDMATVRHELRPKSGVYAVRQGKVLADNLVAYARGKELKQYYPQRKALALMSLSNGSALASRGGFFYQGKLAWRLKHRIDSGFIKKFSELPEMDVDFDLTPGLVDKQAEQRLRKHALRCAGCGAKVASQTLSAVLGELPNRDTTGGNVRDDAALIDLGDGRVLVQTVDFLKAFVNDPWLFARIASNHSLSDIHAMGISAQSAQALVGVPPATPALGKAQLAELMLGCSDVLAAEDCTLEGGHSAEADSLQFGLCVNAIADPQTLLHKTGLQQGDMLVLTKPLGTGTLLAADMRYRARHQWMQAAFASMLLSSREAGRVAAGHGATACTDITGFGLAGHLLEMLAPGVEVELDTAILPVLDGALDCLRADITSSLHHDNSLASDAINFGRTSLNDPRVQLLFDPQTAGGLLFGVSAANVQACLADLAKAGYDAATVIGRVTATGAAAARINLG
ncbi:MAG: hypothetical protein PsegKO_12810 [Pseudohongiellaceae bacterium]